MLTNGGYTDLTVHEQITEKAMEVAKVVHQMTQFMSQVDTRKLDGSILPEDFAYLCGYVAQLAVTTLSLSDATRCMKNDRNGPGELDFLKGLNWPIS